MKKFNIFRFVLCVCVLALTNSRALAGSTVTVGNVPLPVQGTVSVDSIGSLPPVTGTVSVSNLPTTQAVSGTVSVSNLPTSQSVSGTVNVGNTASSPVPTLNVGGGAATQVGQPASSLVNLNCNSPISLGVSVCFQRVNSDGTMSSPFVIPVGQALVLTDIEWSLPGSTPNATKLFSVSVQGNQVAFVSTVADQNGLAAGQWHFATGIVVASTATITVTNVFNQMNFPNQLAYLQGYLVPSP